MKLPIDNEMATLEWQMNDNWLSYLDIFDRITEWSSLKNTNMKADKIVRLDIESRLPVVEL